MATFSERSDSGVEEAAINRVIRSIDLVAAARRQVGFLKRVYEAQWLHHPPTLLHAIRRYDELWMPLISDLTVGSIPPMVLPPLDVQWVWFCHTLNPGSYRLYCESRFSKILEKPAVFDDLNEEYALNTCIEIWSSRYPSEPFELEPITVDDDSTEIVADDDTIASEVSKHKSLYSKFSDPYVSEIVYLIAAKLRYQRFLYLLHKTKDGYSKLVPTVDIHLMWITHQSYPVIYAEDMKEMERDLRKVVGVWDTVEDEDIETTKKLWDETFEQPLEKAGGSTIIELMMKKKPLFYWEDWNADVNSKYKSMEPRFLLEVCVFVRGNRETKETKRDFLRFKTVRCHREIKIDKPITSCNTWRKMWHMYCEFGTRGVVLELRQSGGGGGGSPLFFCSKEKSSSSKMKARVPFVWNELLRAQCLTLERELGQNWRLVASITPPTQAPYLLKCVPDRVTDDSGAMVSDLILKMNRYRPQEGRWLSRTVLDHGGRECFVLRIRVGRGFWRRGGEVPVGVKMEERVIEVREGSWKYVAGPVGRAPDKVVGTATPKASEMKGCWSLSTGYELTVQWESSSGLGFNLQNETSPDSVRLLKGRKMQYQVNDMDSKSKEEQEKEEDEFVTLVRYTPENPKGRATALMNWRMLVVELLPEEDAVLVLLLCMAILRSVSEIKREDVGGLLIRRRLKESAVGLRDWGSVLLHPSMSDSSTSLFSSPHLQPWYWDAKTVMASVEADHYKTTDFRYSPTEGDDKLYKRGIIP